MQLRTTSETNIEHHSWVQIALIFWVFFKISPITFGGGFAMLPAIEREFLEKRSWLTEKEMAEAISIGSAAPGGIGVNAAVFIGYKLQGWRGLLAALLGIMIPSFIIVVGLFAFFSQVQDNPKAAAALKGIQAGVVALIAQVGFRMFRSSVFDKTTFFLFAAGLAALLCASIAPLFILAAGALLGIGIIGIRDRKGLALVFEKQRKEQFQTEDKLQETKPKIQAHTLEYYL